MTEQKTITAVAFEPGNGLGELPLNFQMLPFPKTWKALFGDLQREVAPNRNGYAAVPIWSLNSALRALAPDLVTINKWAAGYKAEHWLVAKRPSHTEALFLIVRAWMDAEFQRAATASREKVLGAIQADDLVWQDEVVDIAKAGKLPNGTVDPHPLTYNVLPNHLAWSIETASTPIKLGGETLTLRRMALEPGASGAELVSWPPHEGRKGNRTGLFSYFFRFTVQTIAFNCRPVVYLHIGIRRWITEPTGIPSGTSVVIETSVPWLKQFDAANSLTGTAVNCLPKSQDFRLVYRDKLSEILDALHVNKLPDLNEMKDDPERWIRSKSGISAAFVFSERLKNRHAVGTGVSADERRKLVEQIAPVLEQCGFVMSAPLTPAFQRPIAVSNPFFASASQKRKTETEEEFTDRKRVERVGRLMAAANDTIDLEVLYQSSSVLSSLKRTLAECIGEPHEQGETTWEWNLDKVRLSLAWRELGALGRNLDLPHGRSNPADRVAAAYIDRISEFKKCLPQTKSPTGTIVELAGEEVFKSAPEQDPKDAIRLALAATGRVSQFMTPAEGVELLSGPDHRARASWYDLFRQLGVGLELPGTDTCGLPPGIRVVGVWLIKRTKRNSSTKTTGFLPVAVYWDSRDDMVYALINGINKPLPYPDALIAVGAGGAAWLNDEADTVQFVRSLLDELKGGGDTLVICDKHNLGTAWKWLNNNRIQKDAITFASERPVYASSFPGIRVLRIRSESSNFETPEWYREKGRDTKFAKGLWYVSDRVFGSTYGKPTQAKMASHYTSKLAPWMNSNREKTFDPRPQDNLPNPGFYEFTLTCLQDGDDPASWALLAHVLRDAAVHFSDAIARPYPLLLAQRIEEYAIPVEPSGSDSHSLPTRSAARSSRR